jgi:hypothetical protein
VAGLTERYAKQIAGVLSCLDRVVIVGTLPDIAYSGAAERYLRSRNRRLFDYPRWAEPLKEVIRKNAERVAKENGLEIEHIWRGNFDKEKRVEEVLAQRGEAPGMVHIFSVMESCPSYQPWHDKRTHETHLRGKEAKCLHYYFYFIHPQLGLCYLRVPTWAPFRLQFGFNGHNALARALTRKGIPYRMADNAFVEIGNFKKAQRLADAWPVWRLHRQLDQLARRLCPVLDHFPAGYHWSVMQVEYSTDVIFRRASDLAPVYELLSRTVVQAVRADRIATFLGRKLKGNYQGEVGNSLETRIEGTRIKHSMGPVSIKMYDKQGRVLRIETTINDVTFFTHHRRVEHRNGTWEMKNASVRKTIYSLPVLQDLMGAANQRYLDFLGTLDDPSAGLKRLEQLSQPVRHDERSWRGFNLFDKTDLSVFEAISRGEFTISGLSNRRLRRVLPGYTGPQRSRILKRLHLHGLLKKIGHTYKYYLTRLGQKVLACALKLRRMFLVPELADLSLA